VLYTHPAHPFFVGLGEGHAKQQHGLRGLSLNAHLACCIGPVKTLGGAIEEAKERVVDQSAHRFSARSFDIRHDMLVRSFDCASARRERRGGKAKARTLRSG
jgi:hypothetical protein